MLRLNSCLGTQLSPASGSDVRSSGARSGAARVNVATGRDNDPESTEMQLSNAPTRR